jgi:hypothetical protein
MKRLCKKAKEVWVENEEAFEQLNRKLDLCNDREVNELMANYFFYEADQE